MRFRFLRPLQLIFLFPALFLYVDGQLMCMHRHPRYNERGQPYNCILYNSFSLTHLSRMVEDPKYAHELQYRIPYCEEMLKAGSAPEEMIDWFQAPYARKVSQRWKFWKLYCPDLGAAKAAQISSPADQDAHLTAIYALIFDFWSDGGRFAKSTAAQTWPGAGRNLCLRPEIRNKPTEVIPIFLTWSVGKAKFTSLGTFFMFLELKLTQPNVAIDKAILVPESLREFLPEPVKCQAGKPLLTLLQDLFCDCEAWSKLTGNKSYGGFCGCPHCYLTGEVKSGSTRVSYSGEPTVEKKNKVTVSQRFKIGTKEAIESAGFHFPPRPCSPLYDAPWFDIFDDSPPEQMHVNELGVARHLLEELTEGPAKSKVLGDSDQWHKLSKTEIEATNRDFETFPLTANDGRKGRGFDELPRWKAEETRNCLLKFGPSIFFGRTPQSRHEALMTLKEYTELCWKTTWSLKDSEELERLARKFIGIWMKCAPSDETFYYKLHLLLEAALRSKYNGSPRWTMATQMESWLGIMMRLTHGKKNPYNALFNNMLAMYRLGYMKPQSSVRSLNDGVQLIGHSKQVFVHVHINNPVSQAGLWARLMAQLFRPVSATSPHFRSFFMH